MHKISLEQSGTAKWLDIHAYDTNPARETASASLLEAVRFVMEQLPPAIRGSAWIETDTGVLPILDIQNLYAATRHCRRSSDAPARSALTPDPSIDISAWDSEGGAQPKQSRSGPIQRS